MLEEVVLGGGLRLARSASEARVAQPAEEANCQTGEKEKQDSDGCQYHLGSPVRVICIAPVCNLGLAAFRVADHKRSPIVTAPPAADT